MDTRFAPRKRKRNQPVKLLFHLDPYLARFSRYFREITTLGGKRCRIFIRFPRRRASISFRPRLLVEFHRNVYVNYFLRFIGRGITSSGGKKHAFKSKACTGSEKCEKNLLIKSGGNGEMDPLRPPSCLAS